jgi:DNA polymerase-3 subunit delta'
MTLLAWHRPIWDKLLASVARLPHALLLVGPSGGGKHQFAVTLGQRLLCLHAEGNALACGQCQACHWLAAGTHPDWINVFPESEEENDAVAEGSKRSQQIKIEQIRALQQRLSMAGLGADGRRVVLIDPADAMNSATANALLKLLEEPPAGVIFLLVSAAPHRLLPTLLSRCQRWHFPRPALAEGLAWLADQNVSEASALLALCSGMPLAVTALVAHGGAAAYARFVRDLQRTPSQQLLFLAADWEGWLKSKEGMAAGMDMPRLLEWLQRWVADLYAVRLGAPVRFFPEQEAWLSATAVRVSRAGAQRCYQALTRFKGMARHPLNSRLLLENVLSHYADLLQEKPHV